MGAVVAGLDSLPDRVTTEMMVKTTPAIMAIVIQSLMLPCVRARVTH